MKQHYWFGTWVDNLGLEQALPGLQAHIAQSLTQPFPQEALLAATQAVAERLDRQDALYQRLATLAAETTAPADVTAMLQGAAAALQRDALQARLRAELGHARPGVLERRYPDRQFEAWLPVGCVVHVAPANVFLVAALSLVESLLVGNLNIVKVSARDSAFAAIFAEALCEADPSGRLRDYIAVTHLPSSDTTRLQTLFSHADAISAWGGETAVAAIRRMAPAGARVITWGHKLSFGYIAHEVLSDNTALDLALDGFAQDVCRLDQQACSSPQTLFVEGDDAQLQAFADALAHRLAAISPSIPRQPPETAAQAEISMVTGVARAEEALGLVRVLEDPQGSWRIFVDQRPGLRPSPLYRSIWLKAIRRDELVVTLRPMRAWLQTCGLACGRYSLAPLTRALFAAGITRIARPGEMTDSYVGAPHDGVYALQQLARRVSLDAPEAARGIGSLAELEAPRAAPPEVRPIMSKKDFLALPAPAQMPDLVFRSGGSSGNTVFSTFSWADYHEQMTAAAHGLVAAGLEPERDHVMNLFAAGHLYGSFISFWSILEVLKARQAPMGLIGDYAEIADAIIALKVNALIGAPSHLMGLFEQEGERLRGLVEKVFYGGEALTRSQRRRLTDDFGVRLIRSAAYGSNDAGPMGYQCLHCEGGVHHLLASVQHLEIVGMDEDRPVAAGESGRLLLTTSPSMRATPAIQRYEIGDTGRWVDTPCACGRADPLFEIQGRIGDLFKAGGPFFNVRRFIDILDREHGYSGPTQIHLRDEEAHTVLEVWIGATHGLPADTAAASLRTHYPEIEYCSTSGMAFRFRVHAVPDDAFVYVTASGKLKPICDHRQS